MSWPKVTDEHRAAVQRVMERGQFEWPGPEAELLEHEWGAYVGAAHCAAVSSGTYGIQAALGALGVGEGDEVIVPSLTFSGSVLPVLSLGAVPVFADVDWRTFNITPETVAAQLTRQTAAVIAVHLHGLTIDIAGLVESLPSDVAVIEDACQAPGAYLPTGERAGTVGRLGVFSLNQKKPLWGGEGGLVTTNDPELDSAVRSIRLYGEAPILAGVRSYLATRLGGNGKITEMAAALARASLVHLRDVNARSRAAGQFLDARLHDVDMMTPQIPQGADHIFHKYRVLCPNGIARNAMLAARAPVSLWQTHPLPLHPVFGAGQGTGEWKVAQRVLDRSVIVGNEQEPLSEQRFEDLAEWAVQIREALS